MIYDLLAVLSDVDGTYVFLFRCRACGATMGERHADDIAREQHTEWHQRSGA